LLIFSAYRSTHIIFLFPNCSQKVKYNARMRFLRISKKMKRIFCGENDALLKKNINS
jgi:hypothetical protein